MTPKSLPSSKRQSKERLLTLSLALCLAATCLWGKATIPSDAELVAQAASHTNPKASVKAMHALAVRGYWELQPPAELTELLAQAPWEVEQFLQAYAPKLLKRQSP